MPEENIIYGGDLERTIYSSLGELAFLLLQVHDREILQIDGDTDEKLSANLLLNRSIKLAKWLREQGIGEGDSVSINSENRLEYSVIVIAIFFVGATLAPFNPDYTPGELLHVANLSKPKIVFCSKRTLNKMQALMPKLVFVRNLVALDDVSKRSPSVVSYQNILKGITEGPIDSNFEVTNINPDETIATILCSSGTTGMPKGVMTTHTNMTVFLDVGRQTIADLLDETERRISLGLTPFFHSMGFMYMFINLMSGNLIVVMKKFRPKIFLQTIEKYKVSHLVVPPPVVLFLTKNDALKYDLTSLTDVRCGAAPMSKEMEVYLKQKLKLKHTSQAYGMTETTLGVLINRTIKTKTGSVGQVVPGMWAKVIDENGKALGVNQEGELCFKGPLIMKGYIGDVAATNIAIDKDGWLHTGDVGYYDEDGYFFIVDRIKELIKYKAFQVAPAELEGLLLNHPSILDAAVIGLPDEEAGELPLAFVVKAPGSPVTEKEIEEYIAVKVSPQKRLRGGVHFIDEVPKNPTGKILRRVLRDRAKNKKSKL